MSLETKEGVWGLMNPEAFARILNIQGWEYLRSVRERIEDVLAESFADSFRKGNR